MVEQPAVNRLVAGSNPARGAIFSLYGLETQVTDRAFDIGGTPAPRFTFNALNQPRTLE